MRAAQRPILRRAHAGDAKALGWLSRQSFGEYHPGAEGRGEVLATRPDVFSSVLELDGDIIGFAVLSWRDGQAWLDAIAVAAPHRARGFGGALLQSIESEARRRGARKLGLATADSNLAALDLFLRRGFRIQSRKPRYYDRGQNAVIMTKAL